MANRVFTIGGVSPTRYMALEETLKDIKGIDFSVTPTSGHIKGHGAEVSWTYDGSSTLTVTVLEHPWVDVTGDATETAIRHYLGQ